MTRAYALIPAGPASAINAMQLVAAWVLGVTFLDETLGWTGISGTILIVAGAIYVSMGKDKVTVRVTTVNLDAKAVADAGTVTMERRSRGSQGSRSRSISISRGGGGNYEDNKTYEKVGVDVEMAVRSSLSQ